jgi:hypothetical protein
VAEEPEPVLVSFDDLPVYYRVLLLLQRLKYGKMVVEIVYPAKPTASP